MNNRNIFRMLSWGLVFITCVVLGIYGLLLNNQNKPVEPTNSSVIPIPPIIEESFEITDLQGKITNNIYKTSKGSIKLFINNVDNMNPVILIGENPTLSDNSYNSIISVISVLFNDETVNSYFIENYNSTTIGNKTFNGFDIELNPVLFDDESNYFNDVNEEIIKIVINKNQINL